MPTDQHLDDRPPPNKDGSDYSTPPGQPSSDLQILYKPPFLLREGSRNNDIHDGPSNRLCGYTYGGLSITISRYICCLFDALHLLFWRCLLFLGWACYRGTFHVSIRQRTFTGLCCSSLKFASVLWTCLLLALDGSVIIVCSLGTGWLLLSMERFCEGTVKLDCGFMLLSGWEKRSRVISVYCSESGCVSGCGLAWGMGQVGISTGSCCQIAFSTRKGH
jgi:hypothetical protein